MKRIEIYKAQLSGDTSPEGVEISIARPLPLFEHRPTETSEAFFARCREEFTNQAEKLETVLRDALPGGTYDQLFAVMAKRKASLLVISHTKP